MTEIANSKVDVKLFRRFPDEEGEMDYGPGYLKLYLHNAVDTADEETTTTTTTVYEKELQIVFRTAGTMKVRANHRFPIGKTRVEDLLDTSFENELRYKALADVADMAPGSSGVYGKERITQPQDFPVSLEFDAEVIRDSFVALLNEHLRVEQETQPELSVHDNENSE